MLLRTDGNMKPLNSVIIQTIISIIGIACFIISDSFLIGLLAVFITGAVAIYFDKKGVIP